MRTGSGDRVYASSCQLRIRGVPPPCAGNTCTRWSGVSIPVFSARCAEAEICTHLTRHAIDPLVVELARPLVRDALATRTGLSWVTLDWELQVARLHIRVLPERPLPGTIVAPGVSRAHHHVARLAMAHPDVEGFTLELGVARAPEPDVDIAAGDPRALPDGTPAALAAVLADGMAAGQSVEEAAARAG